MAKKNTNGNEEPLEKQEMPSRYMAELGDILSLVKDNQCVYAQSRLHTYLLSHPNDVEANNILAYINEIKRTQVKKEKMRQSNLRRIRDEEGDEVIITGRGASACAPTG